MTRTTLRRLKDEKKSLVDYANLLGISGSDWNDISQQLLVSEDFFVYRSDRSMVSATPSSCLSTFVASVDVRTLSMALFQPEVSYTSSRVMFVPSFISLIEKWKNSGNVPRLSKGVSYPSSLQNEKSKDIMVSDNPWLVDLFSGGVWYCKTVANNDAYLVLDTTCYELWNRINDVELSYILEKGSSNPAQQLINRFLEIYNCSTYSYLRENANIRGKYLEAIAQTVTLPKVINMRDVLDTPSFEDSLNTLLEKIDGSANLFCYEGNTQARDFAPFVYAEEEVASALYDVAACTGPIREDLPLNLSVLQLAQLTAKTSAPVLWYTRPGNLPQLTFESKNSEIALALQDGAILRFVEENMIKIGMLKNNVGRNINYNIIDSFSCFIRDVQEKINY